MSKRDRRKRLLAGLLPTTLIFTSLPSQPVMAEQSRDKNTVLENNQKNDKQPMPEALAAEEEVIIADVNLPDSALTFSLNAESGPSYSTPKEALKAAWEKVCENGGTLNLLADVDLEGENLTCDNNVSIEINGMDHIIFSSGQSRGVITVEHAALTLNDLTIKQTAGTSDSAAVLYFGSGSSGILNNVRVQNSGQKGYTIKLVNASLECTSGYIHSGQYGIYAADSTIDLRPGTSIECESQINQYGIYLTKNSVLNADRISIDVGYIQTGTTAAVYAGEDSSVTLMDSSLKGDHGVWMSGGLLTMNDCDIISDGTAGYGITLDSDSTAELNNCSVQASYMTLYILASSQATVNQGILSDYNPVRMSGRRLDLNSVTMPCNGPYGLYLQAGNTTLTGNSSASGGRYGLFIDGGGQINVEGGTYSGTEGAVITTDSSDAQISLKGGTFFNERSASHTSVQTSAGKVADFLGDGYAYYVLNEDDVFEYAPNADRFAITAMVTVLPDYELSSLLKDQTLLATRKQEISLAEDLPEGTESIDWQIFQDDQLILEKSSTSKSLETDLEMGSYQASAVMSVNGLKFALPAVQVDVVPEILDNLDVIISQFETPEPKEPLKKELEWSDVYSQSSVSYSPDDDQAAYGQKYDLAIRFRLNSGCLLSENLDLPEGWILEDDGNQNYTLKKEMQIRKMNAALTVWPQDMKLSTHVRTFEQAKGRIFDGFTQLITDESVETRIIRMTSDDFTMEPGASFTVKWELENVDPEPYEWTSPWKGEITVTNRDPLPIENSGWDAFVTYAGLPIDITTSFYRDPNAGTARYYLIEEGKEPVEISRGQLIVDHAGDYVIEMRTEARWPYAAGTARSVLTVNKGNGSHLVDSEMNGWVYGESFNTLQLSSQEFDVEQADIVYRRKSDQTEVIPSSNLDAGEYEVIATLPENERYQAVTIRHDFTVSRAAPKWTDQVLTVFKVDDFGSFTGLFNTDGKMSYTADDESLISITDNSFKALRPGKVIISAVAEESDNYLAGTASFQIEIIKKDWDLEAENDALNFVYGDADFSFPVNQEKLPEDYQLSVEGECIRLNDDHTFTIVKSGDAVLKLNLPETELCRAKEIAVSVHAAPKAITMTPVECSKVYGNPDPAFSWNARGLVNGDEIAGVSVLRQAGEDAGQYELSIQYEGADDRYAITTEKAALTIEPRTALLGWTNTRPVYNGKAQCPVVSVDNLVFNDECMVQVEGEQVHAGTYQARAASLSNKNYVLPENAEHEFRILPKMVVLEAFSQSKVYGESDPPLTYKVTGVVENEALKNVTIERDPGEKPGTYDIMPFASSDNNPDYFIELIPGELTISPKVLEIVWSEDELVYNRTLQHPKLSLNGVVEGDQVNCEISGARTAAGKGLATAVSLDHDCYVFSENNRTKEFEIKPRAAHIKIEDFSKIYGQADPELSWTIENWLEDQLPAVELERESGEDAGKYDINVSILDLDENYTLDVDEAVLNILPKTVLLEWSDEALIYNGKAQAPSVSIARLENNDECEVTVEGHQIHAGNDWQAKAVSLSNTNYALPEESSVSFSILPKPLTVKAENALKVYGESDPEFDWNKEGLAEGDQLKNLSFTRAPGENADSYAISPVISQADNPDYAIEIQNGTLEVVPRTVDVIWSEETLVYNGQQQLPEIRLENVLDQDEVHVSLTGSRIHAGTGRAVIENLDNANYRLPQSGLEREFVIEPKEAAISVSNASKIYGQPDPEFVWQIEGWIEQDLPEISISRLPGEDAGSYDIEVCAGKDYPDYDLACKKGEMVIQPKTVSLEWSKEAFVYNGKEQIPGVLITNLEKNDECEMTVEGARINAGTGYKAVVSALSNKNYALPENNSCIYDIEPASIENLELVLKNLVRENGSLQQQNLEDFKDLEEDDFIISGHQADKGGSYILRVQGTGNYQGTVSIPYVVLPSRALSFARNEENHAQIGLGELQLEFVQDKGLPETKLVSLHEDLLNLLADNDLIHPMMLSDIAKGEQGQIRVSLKKEILKPQVKKALDDLDLDWTSDPFSLQIEHTFIQSDQDPSGSVALSMKLPEKAASGNVQIMLYALENDGLKSVPVTVSSGRKSVAFNGDPSRVYILVLKESEEPVKSETPAKTPASDKKTASGNEKQKKPAATGIKTSSMMAGLICSPGLMAVLRKKKHNK